MNGLTTVKLPVALLLKRGVLLTIALTLTVPTLLPGIGGAGGRSHAAAPMVMSSGSRRTYTTDADFDQGTLFNVNHTGPNSNQLQLNSTLTTYPVMWIPNAGEDTVSKINTNTGKELARYRTWFGPSGQPGYFNHLGFHNLGASPSRLAIDSDGNAYVANRHFDGRPADVIKILAEGGIDRNNNGMIDTSSDTNSNGIIESGEILPMGDTNANGRIDPSEIQDERVAWVVSVGPNDGVARALALDVQGNVWLGLYQARSYYKLSPVDGSILTGPINVAPHTPYGAIVDRNGILWGAAFEQNLLKLDTNTNVVKIIPHNSIGHNVTIGNGRVYKGSFSGHTYIEINPITESYTLPAKVWYSCLGVALDTQGNIFAGQWIGGSVTKFRPDGTVIWTAPAQTGFRTDTVHGTIVDSNDDVWLVHRNGHSVSKFEGATGAAKGVFLVGNRPETYSDATGLIRFTNTKPSGKWSVVQDSGTSGNAWGTVTWNTEPQGNVPAGASITVEARASDTLVGLGGQTFVGISNGTSFNLTGRFIEVRAILSPNNSGQSPVLSDISINSSNLPPVASAGGPYTVNEGSSVSVTAAGSTDPDVGDTLTYAWDLDYDGSFETPGQVATFSAAALDGPTSRTINVRVTDSGGLSATATAIVDVLNAAPAVTSPGNQIANEGSSTSFNLGSFTDPGPDSPWKVEVNWGDSSSSILPDKTATGSLGTSSHSYANNGLYTVAVKVTDKDGAPNTKTFDVSVANMAPVVGLITAPVNAVKLGTAISVTANFTDPGNLDTHTATINWGDGTSSTGTVSESNGNGSVSGSRSYTKPGVYEVKVTVVDNNGAGGNSIYQYVIIYNPTGGSIATSTQAPLINSPAGAYPTKPTTTGNASLGFNAKYAKGATKPSGAAVFNFLAGGLSFTSTGYQWLVISGQNVWLRGTGTISNAGSYEFLITAVDGQVSGASTVDRFRIKIWVQATGTVIYDNQMGAAFNAVSTQATVSGSGNIAIGR